MAELYHCSAKVIQRFAKEIGYVNVYRRHLTYDEKQEVIAKYYTHTSKELAKEYNVSQSLITKTWRDADIHDTKGRHVYPFNFDYFEDIDSNDKAYFLGLLAADGNVFKRNNNDNTQAIIKLALQYEDRYVLEVFKEYVLSNKPLRVRTKESKLFINCFCELELVSDKMMQDLSKYNITPRKTYTFVMPDLDDQFISHFIRGYFDGDGCITVEHEQYHKPSAYTCSISGYKENLLKIQDILNRHGISSHFVIDARKEKYTHDSFGALSISSIDDITMFINYIYKNCKDLYIPRKKYKSDCFLQARTLKNECKI